MKFYKETMGMVRWFIILITTILLLHGCVIPITQTVYQPLDSLYSLAIPGKTSRSELTEIIGEPIISNSLYSVDVYRVLARSEDSFTTLFFPIASPSRANTFAYGLVSFDEKMVIKDITWGHGKKYEESDFNLAVDGFLFESENYDKFMSPRKTIILFARKSDSQQLLRGDAPKGKCLLHVAPSAHVHTIKLDNVELASYPLNKTLKQRVWFKGFITIELPVGEHTLSMARLNYAGAPGGPVEYKNMFSCDSEKKYYAYSNIESYKWTDSNFAWPSQYMFRGNLTISDTLPEVFKERRLILYREDLHDD